MNRIFGIAALSLMLAACGQEAPAPSSTAPAAAPSSVEQPAPKPVAAEAGDTGIEILASHGIEIPFPHAVNYDIKDVSKNGTPRRRVLLEILEGGFESSVAAFESVLTNQGYVRAEANDQAGKLQRTYVKDGNPTYYLLSQSVDAGPALSDAGASGSIHIMWNER